MKKKSIISALVLTMAIGMGATVYAASNDSAASPGQRLRLGRITSMRGYDYVINILKNKLGLTDKDITDARNSGKTLYDLAVEKGITQDQLKNSMFEEKSRSIDEVVNKGNITKEEGENLKAELKTNMESCTLNFGQRLGIEMGQGRGQGCGMAGNGQGRFR